MFINTLHELLLEEVKDLYDAENQLLKALPKMAEAAFDPELKRTLVNHHDETKTHIGRLENAFERLSAPREGKACRAMQALIEEGAEAIRLSGPDAIRDALLIGASQRIEHFEIAAYGTARAFAETVGENEIVDLFELTLDEEKTADEKLTKISRTVNEEANAVGLDSRQT